VASPDLAGMCKETFYGVVFGSADAFTTPKVRPYEFREASPISSSCDISPDLGRGVSLLTPPKKEDEDEEMCSISTDLLDLCNECNDHEADAARR
jgi:hypothetical protein